MQTKKNPAAANSGAEKATTSDFEYNTSTAGDTSQICDPVDEFNEVLPDSEPDEDLDTVPGAASAEDQAVDAAEAAVMAEVDRQADIDEAYDKQAQEDSDNAKLTEAFKAADEKEYLEELFYDDYDEGAEAVRAADAEDQAANPLTVSSMAAEELVDVSPHSGLPIDELCGAATHTYVAKQVEAGHKLYLREHPKYLLRELTLLAKKVTEAANEHLDKKDKHPHAKGVQPSMYIAAYQALYSPVRIRKEGGGKGDEPLMSYVDDPTDMDYGIYVSAEKQFEAFADKISATPLTAPMLRSMVRSLRNQAPTVEQSTERLVVLANGLFDYKAQKLLPFTREKVFLSKSDVAWNPQATLPVIERPDGTTWDIESCLRELSTGDADVLALYWQVIGAALRATEKWKKMIVFYGPQGNNGKSTILTLIEHLVGRRNVMSSDMTGLSKRFGLDQLVPDEGGAPQLIVSHENDEAYLPKIGAIKALITQDTTKVEIKSQRNLSFNWRGLILQGMNELPKTKESNCSVTRRLLLTPFMAEIVKPEDADGAGPNQIIEEPAVVEDYVTRREVLEYVAYRTLSHDMTPEYTHFTIPEASRELLAEQTVMSDPVAEFWQEFRTRFAWGFVPSTFLYDLYKAWMAQVNPSSHPIGQKSLPRKLKDLVNKDVLWKWPDDAQRPGDRMDEPEPLIVEYYVEQWTNLLAGKTNTRARATLRVDQIPDRCSGIVYVGHGVSRVPVDGRGPSRPNGVGEADNPDLEPVQAPKAPQERQE